MILINHTEFQMKCKCAWLGVPVTQVPYGFFTLVIEQIMGPVP